MNEWMDGLMMKFWGTHDAFLLACFTFLLLFFFFFRLLQFACFLSSLRAYVCGFVWCGICVSSRLILYCDSPPVRCFGLASFEVLENAVPPCF